MSRCSTAISACEALRQAGSAPPALRLSFSPGDREEGRMSARRHLFSGATAVALGVAVAAAPTQAQQAGEPRIGDKDLGGIVTGANGPEAGVWVIAETGELPTKYAKMVVTDAQ